jgi:hypothetical protein
MGLYSIYHNFDKPRDALRYLHTTDSDVVKPDEIHRMLARITMNGTMFMMQRRISTKFFFKFTGRKWESVLKIEYGLFSLHIQWVLLLHNYMHEVSQEKWLLSCSSMLRPQTQMEQAGIRTLTQQDLMRPHSQQV